MNNIYNKLTITNANDKIKTDLLLKFESIYPPKGGPIVKERPRVARASP